MQRHETNKINTIACDFERIYKHYEPSVRFLRIRKTVTGSCGFNLTRTKWDPYPWVNAVDAHTAAEMSGLKAGDCVLEVNGEDVLGLRITDIAKLVQIKSGHVTLLLWSCGSDFKCDPETICCAPMPQTMQRLATIVKSILTIIECPVCMNTITPPVMQCRNGHLLCLNCRIRAEKCPVCRDRYTPQRALIAEQIYAAITSAYNLCSSNEDKLRQKLFGDGTETGMNVKSRRWRREEAAKQTIEGDQLTEAGDERFQMKIKNQWRNHIQRKGRQCQSQYVASLHGIQSGHFKSIKNTETDGVRRDVGVVVTDVTDANAAKYENKKKEILIKLWNGKASSMENLSTQCHSTKKIKPIRSGQRNSKVIDTSRYGNEETVANGLTTPVLESQIMASFPTSTPTLKFFSNLCDNNKRSNDVERALKNLQNYSTLNENNSDSTCCHIEEAKRTTTMITTNTPLTTQQMKKKQVMTMPLNCMKISKTILNNAATNNVAYLNAMSKLLSSATTTTTTTTTTTSINDLTPTQLLPHLPPLSQQPHKQQSYKTNESTAIQQQQNIADALARSTAITNEHTAETVSAVAAFNGLEDM